MQVGQGIVMSKSDLVCDLVIDAVVEWLGLKYRKSQIKLELAKINGGNPLDFHIVDRIISLAKEKIRDIYHVDAVEYKGSAIEFYQSIIRNPKIKIKYKLQAQQRLDTLLGLEHLATDDPKVYAEKVKEAMQAMDNSVDGIQPQEQKPSLKETEKTERKDPFEEVHDDEITEGLKDVELKDDGLSLKNS